MRSPSSDELRDERPLIELIRQVFPELIGQDEDGDPAVFVGGILMTMIRALGELEDRLLRVEATPGPAEWRGSERSDMDESATAKIGRLRGVTWEWRDEVDEEVKEAPGMGVIAQDVERVFPELVERTEDGYLAVHYHGLIGPLIEAVKELDQRIRALEEPA